MKSTEKPIGENDEKLSCNGCFYEDTTIKYAPCVNCARQVKDNYLPKENVQEGRNEV